MRSVQRRRNGSLNSLASGRRPGASPLPALPSRRERMRFRRVNVVTIQRLCVKWIEDPWHDYASAPALNEPSTTGGRRNPASANPRRTGGPPPRPTPKELAKARRRWLENFRRTRGFPEGADREVIEIYRRQGRWYKNMAPPEE